MSSKPKSADKAAKETGAKGKAPSSGKASASTLGKGKNPGAERPKPLPVSVELENGRGRHLGWIAFCGAIGLLFLLKLGSIGQYVGGGMLVIAVLQAVSAARTFMHKPGTFLVTEDKISVPIGLCRGKELSLELAQLEHAFFLRRAVPWSKAGPILVVEAKGKAYSYPRDWFASDSDQRRVAMALNHRLAAEDKA